MPDDEDDDTTMKEEEAYTLLQELLDLAEKLKDSGHYAREDIIHEIEQRIDG